MQLQFLNDIPIQLEAMSVSLISSEHQLLPESVTKLFKRAGPIPLGNMDGHTEE